MQNLYNYFSKFFYNNDLYDYKLKKMQKNGFAPYNIAILQSYYVIALEKPSTHLVPLSSYG